MTYESLGSLGCQLLGRILKIVAQLVLRRKKIVKIPWCDLSLQKQLETMWLSMMGVKVRDCYKVGRCMMVSLFSDNVQIVEKLGYDVSVADGMFVATLRWKDGWQEALGEWKPMDDAFRDRNVIIDNHNTTFFEPKTNEDRERGFAL